MLANNLTLEDEESVQLELRKLEAEEVRHTSRLFKRTHL